MAVFLSGWILPIGGVESGRYAPAACFEPSGAVLKVAEKPDMHGSGDLEGWVGRRFFSYFWPIIGYLVYNFLKRGLFGALCSTCSHKFLTMDEYIQTYEWADHFVCTLG